MTTIAYDGKLLAADSRTTRTTASSQRWKCPECEADVSKTRSDDKLKLHGNWDNTYFEGQRVFAVGAAGSTMAIDMAMRIMRSKYQLQDGLEIYTLTTEKVLDCALLIVCEENVFTVKPGAHQAKIKKYPLDINIAIGSGAKVAEMAMKILGLTAPEAIHAAASFDDATGGLVQYVLANEPMIVPKSVIKDDNALTDLGLRDLMYQRLTALYQPPKRTEPAA